MPAKHFYLDNAKTHRIELHWGVFWKKMRVTENGQLVGQVKSPKELRTGCTFSLATGRPLTVRLRRVFLSEELEVLLDGQPLADSAAHPTERFKQGLYTLLFLAFFNVGLGLLAELTSVELLRELGLGYGTALVGLLYLGCYGWARIRLSATAMYLAMGLLALDFVLAMVLTINAKESHPPTAGLFMRLAFCTLLYKAAQSAQQLRGERQVSLVAAA